MVNGLEVGDAATVQTEVVFELKVTFRPVAFVVAATDFVPSDICELDGVANVMVCGSLPITISSVFVALV